MSNPTVATTILQQLGGDKFLVMTGAKNLVHDDTSLTMKLGRNPKGVAHVTVQLTSDDLYTVRFYGRRGAGVATVEGVGVEQLREVFESHTELRTSL